MPDPTTSNIKFSVPLRGADPGTWDLPNNGDWLIADNCLGTVTNVALSNTNVALSVTQAQSNVLRFSGTLTASVAVGLPAIQKTWTVENNTTGPFFITLTAGAGKVIGLPPGEPVQVYSDGTDVKFLNLGRTGKIEAWFLPGALPSWVTVCTVQPYLICDGTTFNATTYAALNTVLGSNTLPDCRGRALFMANLGTGRITTAGSGIDGDALGSVGGEQNHTLTAGESAALSYTSPTGITPNPHGHVVTGAYTGQGIAIVATSPSGAQVPNSPILTGATDTVSLTATTTVSSNAGEGAHNNPTWASLPSST